MGITDLKDRLLGTEDKSDRKAISPATSAATGTVAAGIGQFVAFLIVSNNPEMAPFLPVMAMGFTGLATGIGNFARTTGGWAKALFGWIG